MPTSVKPASNRAHLKATKPSEALLLRSLRGVSKTLPSLGVLLA
jgi:hypothetical protein